MASNIRKIAFQGSAGAYSDMACRAVFPGVNTLPCAAFEDAFLAVRRQEADLAMIPVDNTLAGRVADVHHLIPNGGLFIIGEHFQPIRHCLLGVRGAEKASLRHVHSHIHALPQCRRLIARLNLKAHVHADTAGAAALIAEKQDPSHCAIASALAAEIYGLEIFEEDVQDESHNTTRFLILGPEPEIPEFHEGGKFVTTLMFQVRNIPASLYKSLGGFATGGISIAKLESYVDENFQAARFYCDVESHPDSRPFKLALEELGFYARDIKFLGTYPAHSFRRTYDIPTDEI